MNDKNNVDLMFKDAAHLVSLAARADKKPDANSLRHVISNGVAKMILAYGPLETFRAISAAISDEMNTKSNNNGVLPIPETKKHTSDSFLYGRIDGGMEEQKLSCPPIHKYDYFKCRVCGVAWDAHATHPQAAGCKNQRPPGEPKLSASDKRSIEVNMRD